MGFGDLSGAVHDQSFRRVKRHELCRSGRDIEKLYGGDRLRLDQGFSRSIEMIQRGRRHSSTPSRRNSTMKLVS